MISQIGIMFDMFGNSSGPHTRNAPLCEITVKTALLGSLQWILYQISALSAKTAILVLYRRIFSPVRLANILIFSSITCTVVFYVSMAIAFIVGVVPRSVDYAAQLPATDAERALRLSPPLTATCSVIGLIIDVYILVVPFFFIWDLNMPTKRKIGISAIFITGSTAVIFSLVGAVYRLQLAITKRGNDSWVSMPMFAMNVAEINIGIAASCMPVVFVLFRSSMEKTILFVTKLWFSVASRSQGGTKTPAGESSKSHGPYQEICNKDLPEIPAAEVTGMRSFLLNIGRTNPVASHKTHSSVMLTEVSEVNDYHDHLRNG
ncbi:hypothetical protein INS49_005656 [Diaporthe citri]|uniref:uncharacterized protein n=1 Tax=Diaporthe citri TaxID=83186 RepID=UPI001C80FF55|nr:uncharacterized protein INS49_005656 [Diaporthe citri]KAG6353475.1 hypothetical protein INS49_005656 [Diaporthe citri]